MQTENEKLKLEISVSDLQNKSLKDECEKITNEKQQLSQMIDRRNNEIERLKVEAKEFEQKLKENLYAKCEVLTQLNSCSTKEASLDMKSKLFEQEKSLLQNQLQNLRFDLERNMNEMANIRRESAAKEMAIETKLFEKIEELKLTKSINSQLEKSNESLSSKVEDLSNRIKSDADETQKLIEHYEKELQSQKKLVALYKENCDENAKQMDDLTKNIKELQSLLHEATDEFGVLENKMKENELKYQSDINNKEVLIKQLNDDLLKAHNLNQEKDNLHNEATLDSISSLVCIAKRFKTGELSSNELYTAFVKVSNELQQQNKENEKLKLQFKHILNEIEEKAPILKKERAERSHLLETNAYLSQQIENIADSHKETQTKMADLNTKANFLQRENQKLKSERGDLARQVCYLLQKIDEMENHVYSGSAAEVTTDMTSNEVITKNLVTFSNIAELQETNMKLLLLVRDLSSKLEEMDENNQSENNEKLESKVSIYTKKIEELRCSQEFQTEMIENCMKQRDRFKELYLESIKNRTSVSDHELDGTNDQKNRAQDSSNLQTKIDELSKIIEQKDKALVDMEKCFEKYKTEKSLNEKLITEQLEKMRSEVRELTSKNCKIASAIEFKTEQLQINVKMHSFLIIIQVKHEYN